MGRLGPSNHSEGTGVSLALGQPRILGEREGVAGPRANLGKACGTSVRVVFAGAAPISKDSRRLRAGKPARLQANFGWAARFGNAAARRLCLLAIPRLALRTRRIGWRRSLGVVVAGAMTTAKARPTTATASAPIAIPAQKPGRPSMKRSYVLFRRPVAWGALRSPSWISSSCASPRPRTRARRFLRLCLFTAGLVISGYPTSRSEFASEFEQRARSTRGNQPAACAGSRIVRRSMRAPDAGSKRPVENLRIKIHFSRPLDRASLGVDVHLVEDLSAIADRSEDISPRDQLV